MARSIQEIREDAVKTKLRLFEQCNEAISAHEEVLKQLREEGRQIEKQARANRAKQAEIQKSITDARRTKKQLGSKPQTPEQRAKAAETRKKNAQKKKDNQNGTANKQEEPKQVQKEEKKGWFD